MADHMQILTVRVHANVLQGLKDKARETGQEFSAYVRNLLDIGLTLTSIQDKMVSEFQKLQAECGHHHGELLKRDAVLTKQLEDLRAFVSTESEKAQRLLKVSVGGILMETAQLSEEQATAWVVEYLDD